MASVSLCLNLYQWNLRNYFRLNADSRIDKAHWRVAYHRYAHRHLSCEHSNDNKLLGQIQSLVLAFNYPTAASGTFDLVGVDLHQVGTPFSKERTENPT